MNQSTPPALLLENVSKIYSKIVALDDISLSVNQGDFLALIGKNGAGKSTLINIITSLLTKDSGKIKVFGLDYDIEHENAKKSIGTVPQEFNFSIFEKVINILIDQAGFYGISYDIAYERAKKYLSLLNLWEKKDEAALNLSGGMKRRLMIARSLIHEPKLLILDEPTVGVDTEVRRIIWDFLSDLHKNGKTIILTTHYLEEAEKLCDTAAIIDKGKIVKNCKMHNILNINMCQTVIVQISPVKNQNTKENLIEKNIVFLDDYHVCLKIDVENRFTDLLSSLIEHGVNIIGVKNEKSKLESLLESL